MPTAQQAAINSQAAMARSANRGSRLAQNRYGRTDTAQSCWGCNHTGPPQDIWQPAPRWVTKWICSECLPKLMRMMGGLYAAGTSFCRDYAAEARTNNVPVTTNVTKAQRPDSRSYSMPSNKEAERKAKRWPSAAGNRGLLKLSLPPMP